MKQVTSKQERERERGEQDSAKLACAWRGRDSFCKLLSCLWGFN